jgi:hypothetical protein
MKYSVVKKDSESHRGGTERAEILFDQKRFRDSGSPSLLLPRATAGEEKRWGTEPFVVKIALSVLSPLVAALPCYVLCGKFLSSLFRF